MVSDVRTACARRGTDLKPRVSKEKCCTQNRKMLHIETHSSAFSYYLQLKTEGHRYSLPGARSFFPQIPERTGCTARRRSSGLEMAFFNAEKHDWLGGFETSVFALTFSHVRCISGARCPADAVNRAARSAQYASRDSVMCPWPRSREGRRLQFRHLSVRAGIRGRRRGRGRGGWGRGRFGLGRGRGGRSRGEEVAGQEGERWLDRRERRALGGQSGRGSCGGKGTLA